MLFAGFNVTDGHSIAARGLRSWASRDLVRVVDRLRHRLLRPHGAARAARPQAPHHADPAAPGRPPVSSAGDPGAVFFARMLPVLRDVHLASRPGAARMPSPRFTLLTVAGCDPLGPAARRPSASAAGDQWPKWKDAPELPRLLALAGRHRARVVWFAVRWWRNRGAAKPAADAQPEDAVALGLLARPRRAPPHLLLRPRHAAAVAGPAALRRPRPGAAQGLRGRAARGHGGRAAHRPPRRGRRRGARLRPPPRRAPRRLVRPPRRARPARSSGRSSAASARRARSPPAWPRARWPWSPPTARRGSAAGRTRGSADALALGLAQACALVPGVSRNGATLTAARAAPLPPLGRQRPVAACRPAGHRGRHRAQGRAPAPPRDPAGAPRVRSRSAPPPPSPPPWSPRGSSASWSATGRCGPTPLYRLGLAASSSAARRLAVHERRLRRRRGRHRPRPTRGCARSSTSCGRSSPAGRRAPWSPPATTRASCASPPTSAWPCAATAWARSSSWPSRPAATTRSGIDCIAMNVNDLVCVGAEPLAAPRLPGRRGARPGGLGPSGRG